MAKALFGAENSGAKKVSQGPGLEFPEFLATFNGEGKRIK